MSRISLCRNVVYRRVNTINNYTSYGVEHFGIINRGWVGRFVAFVLYFGVFATKITHTITHTESTWYGTGRGGRRALFNSACMFVVYRLFRRNQPPWTATARFVLFPASCAAPRTRRISPRGPCALP